MEELEKALTDALNASTLPLEAKRYILRHLFNIVDINYQYELRIQKLKQEVKSDEQVSQ